jgi:hypothetical protein
MIALALSLLLSCPAARAASAPVYRVISVSGGVLTAYGKPLKKGSPVFEGSTLRLSKGKAVLAFGEEGRVLLTGPAELTVEPRGVSLKLGGLLSVLDKLVNGYRVETPAAVAAVRGTTFYIEARKGLKTYLCLCKGKIDVTGEGGFQHGFEAETHTAFLYAGGPSSVTKSSDTMHGHTDEEIARLLSRDN